VESIEAAEKVCRQWQKLILTSSSVWKSLIFQLCTLKPQFKEILSTKVFTEIKKDPAKLKSFYYHMGKIENNVMNNSFSVRTLNCLDLGASEETEEQNNRSYRGVYDMIHSENRLVASVNDTIQVWDLDTYKRIQQLDSSALDVDGGKTSCYTLQGDVLLCGTENGFIKMFDMKTGKIQSRARRNSNYVSDVAVNGNILVSLDWYGEVTEWNIEKPGHLVQIVSTDRFGGLMLNGANQRNTERLLAFGGDHLVTTNLKRLNWYRKGELLGSYPEEGEVLSISIQGDLLAVGCKNENPDSPMVSIFNLAQEWEPSIVNLKTNDGSWHDSVISVNLSLNYLIFGTVVGELHMVDISQLKFPSQGATSVVELGKENEFGVKHVGTIRTHEYGVFVWAVKADSYRIFSGDETGKIIVHDYMKYQVPN